MGAGALAARGWAAPSSATARQGTPVAGGALVALDRRGGDAWIWEKRLTGSCAGCPPEAEIALRVNGRAVPAERDGDAFAATVRLDPGENEVVAIATRPDGTAEVSAPVVYTVRLEPRPTARLVARVEDGTIVFDGTASESSEYDRAAIRAWTIAAREGNPAPLALTERAPGVVAAPVPVADGEYYADLVVEDEQGRTDAAAAFVVVAGGQARVPDPVHDRAGWIAAAVVYGVVPRNFDPPGFAGVAARLDDLADLRVTALWFSPITKTLPDLFGYEVTDYFDLNPLYGTKEEFRGLVAAAHARGLRVLMDFVPNHTSVEHPYSRDADAYGRASAYWNFYDRDAGGTPTHYFDWFHLPNLNYDNPEVRRFMLEAMSYWVREFGVDGFRVDAVWGIKERRPEWLEELLAELNRIKPDSLLIAEASARDEFYFDVGFDAAYDWTDELGHWAWGDAFGDIAPIGQAMVEVLTDGGRGYHPDALVMRFLNNNDTGPRFVSTYGVGFYRVALAMLLTLPGLPCLYTGDEVGAEFEPYATTGPIDWTDRHDLRPYVERLIALRQRTPSLHSPDWQPLAVAPATPFFAYLRTAGPADPPVVVLLNYSANDEEATVAVPEAVGMLGAGRLRDLLTDEMVAVQPGQPPAVPVPAWGVRVLTDDPA